MPGKIKVKILAGRNLPVMDRSGDTTDAYVEIKFGNTTFKTDVCRKSLNPQWNSEWYRFEVDDAELQDEPLQVRLMDHDTYSANDAIGKVYVNLNPLLLPGLPPTVKNIWTLEATMNSSSGSQGGSVMTGWIPVFDTMHGIRGEVNIIVKVELFSDCNKFRQSSCGVQFFYSPNIPHGYHAQVIHGFVEELVVSDDPEYKWIDKIRTPRASNEARQTLFFKLSGEVQRKIGLKALDLGGNAVIGYVQNFDLEGESGIVARGIGTAVTLVKLQDISSILPLETSNIEELTCFDLQSKSQLDFSESDDSLPLLSHSPNQSPLSRSPTNLHATVVSPRFPKYEKPRRHQRQAVRVAEYRAAGLRARQLSLQHNAVANSAIRKGIGSSMSLADDLISESSLRNMLALEDMRGEPVGNPFSRGLKNFRYLHQNILPRRVAQIKSKITDSFDDESDQDSNYSSTWSLAGSESNRSPSIVDLRQSIRRKKFTHKKAANDGIAALLIRSVHSGFPLDSVREDRETPTPSPVNFLADLAEYSDDSVRRGVLVKKDTETLSFSSAQSSVRLDESFIESQILVGKNKHDVKYTATELLIPMISSSESDTSTSDEDEPSESSTNYNILDDSCSHPSSNDDTSYQPDFGRTVLGVTKLLKNPDGTVESSGESENKMMIETTGDRSVALERDCSLESSTDYNILDDAKSLVECGSIVAKKFELGSQQYTKFYENEKSHLDASKSDYSLGDSSGYSNLDDTNSFIVRSPNNGKKLELSSQVTKLIEAHDKIERFSGIPGSIMIDTENEPSTDLEPDFSLESSTDYNILDDSLIDRSSNNDRKFELSSHQVTKLFESHDKIERISGKSENMTIDIENEGNRSAALEPNCDLESSTDYNIVDDVNSLIVRSSTDDKKFELSSQISKLFESHGKLERFSGPPENMTTDIENEGNHSTALDPDFSLESSTDYNILDDTSSLIEGTSNDGRKFELSSQQTNEVAELLETTKRLEESFEEAKDIGVVSPIEENRASSCQTSSSFEYRADDNILDETYSKLNRISPDDEKSDPSPGRPVQVTNLPDDSITVSSISSSQSEKVDDRLENSEGVEIKQIKLQSSITLRDCHSTSSTNYNFLDESYSPNENSSVDDEKREQNVRGATDVAKFSAIQAASSPLADTPELPDKKLETSSDSTFEKNTAAPQNDSNLESSTDYNILDDVSSLADPNSFDDCENRETSFQRATDFMAVSEILSSSELAVSSSRSSGKFEELSTNQAESEPEATKPEATNEKNIPPSLYPPPILPTLDANLSVSSAGKSASSGPESSPSTTPTKLKHLKFLPKQKHFDSAEDLGFVTSTPVETDVTLFAEFETGQKSSSPNYMDASKFDFQPSTSSSSLARADSKTSKFEPIEKKTSLAETQRTSSLEKRVQQTGRQVCPLGVSFNTVRIVNETKKASPPDKIAKVESVKASSPLPAKSPVPKKEALNAEVKSAAVKKEKTAKKVERTDTVIYKGPAKNRDVDGKLVRVQSTRRTSPIPIVVAPPPEEHATRLQVPVIQTTNINVQSTFSPDEMKTQHFGSIGSRKFPVDECAISDKFNRKFRQHCILDLIRTIDAKMMVHHMHHERRDSTKSKRKRRDRVNASATPSPDSIHRTRPHKRRSRSRSPERPHASHAKNHVSSLSTHSFPNAGHSLMRNPTTNLPLDSSCTSSCENLPRNVNVAPIVVVCPKDPVVTATASVSSSATNNDQDSQNNQKIVVTECPAVVIEDESLPVCKNDPVESVVTSKEVSSISAMSMLDPRALEHPVFKSHSAGSLEGLPRRFPLISKTTNRANTIDDLCVPCSPLTLRQLDEQQAASSPVQASSALPSSLGSKVTPNATTVTKTSTAIPNMHRRSSDSDLSITPKGNSLAGSDRSMGGHMRPSTAIVRTMNQDTMEMLEYPFITMQQYPPGFVLNIGGLVSARSVKLLERITNLEEPEGRDAWWTEIRMEVRSHARALACNVVLGYKEEISICDDVCVLNASGTAAVINLLNANQDQDNVLLNRNLMTTSVESDRDKTQVKTLVAKTDKSDETSLSGQQSHSAGKVKRTSESNDHEMPYIPTLSACSLCHLPYSEASVPFRVDVSKCAICRRSKVPDVLFTTIELPENIPMTGRGVFLQATVCKSKRDLRGELNAKEISDCLPFLEYELHSLLLNKLKVKGMNAIFGLKVQVSVGERLVIGMAVGTAVFLTALPTPSVPQIASGNSWHNEEQLAEIQKTLIETVKKNREFYRLKPITDIENGRSITTSDTDESDDDLPDLDLGIGTKDTCVLEVDDVEDMDRINLLMDEKPPDDFHVVNTQTIPGLEDLEIVRNLQMFTQISRAKIPSGQFASMPSKYFARMLQTVLFKLRRMVPCALCDMQFKVALPEQDEIQLSVVGMALGLGEPTRFSKYKRKLVPNSTSKDPIKKTDDNDMIFSLDEDQADTTTGPQDSNNATNQSNVSSSSPLPGHSAQKHRPRSPFRTKTHMSHRHKHVPLKERYGVDITPLSYLPGGKIERYLGNLNFFFIRESTSIRENGGLSGFTHSFVTEILAIVRAHITALGGNAMVAFFMTQCVLLHSPHKNQGQCLINVGGDVVTVSYYGDDRYQGNQNC